MSDDTARFSYDGLDRVLHERARLGILTALTTQARGRAFGELKEVCALTDGNLNRHLKVLQEAGLVTLRKSATEGRPQTFVRITNSGKRHFLAYLDELERVLRHARGDAESRATDSDTGIAPA